jgi:hypothetical protein
MYEDGSCGDHPGRQTGGLTRRRRVVPSNMQVGFAALHRPVSHWQCFAVLYHNEQIQ